MRCSIVQSTWHEFETNWTKMIAQPPRFKAEPHARNSRAREANQKARSNQGFSSDQKRSRNDNTVIFTWFGCSDEIRASAQHLARKPILKTHRKRLRSRQMDQSERSRGGALSGFCFPSLVLLCLAWGDVSRRHTETNASSKSDVN